MAVPSADSAALAAEAFAAEPIQLADWLVVAPVAIPFFFAALIIMMRGRVDWHAPLAATGFVLMAVANFALVQRVLEEGAVVMVMGRWLPPFGIVFAVDALGAVFALAASLVGLAACIFAERDIDPRDRRFGFFPFLLILVAGVSGAFLTGDIFNLYVWFEVLLIASFGLIVFGGGREQLDGSVKYALLNLVATTIFLIATGLLYGLTGTLNFADLARTVPALPVGAPVLAVAALYLLAFGMKAAAFPVNFWLPASYHTPRMVVAAIFAGLLTKVGIYALLRTFTLVFAPAPDILSEVMIWAGVASMLVGALGALAQDDVRRLMGFLVVSGIGNMLLGLGLASEEALFGTVLYAVHSMIVMTALYLSVGLAQRVAGAHSLNALGGIYRAAPFFSALFLVLAFAVSGLPPFSGFWPKVVLVNASLKLEAYWPAAAVLVSGLLTALATGRVWALAFWRPLPGDMVAAYPDHTPKHDLGPERDRAPDAGLRAPERDWAYLGPIAGLALLAVLLGLFPEPLMELARAGAAGLADPADYINAVLGPLP